MGPAFVRRSSTACSLAAERIAGLAELVNAFGFRINFCVRSRSENSLYLIYVVTLRVLVTHQLCGHCMLPNSGGSRYGGPKRALIIAVLSVRTLIKPLHEIQV